jgi:glyoxylase-like metal-dependent hydrolase (beta-lactamase superfamily II)
MYDFNWSSFAGHPVKSSRPKPLELLDGKEEIRAGDMIFNVIHTPGHSPGGVCLYYPSEDALFSGDTLFCDGIGRTDLPSGNYMKIKHSLEKLFSIFPDDTRVLPGHGPETTIGRERGFHS